MTAQLLLTILVAAAAFLFGARYLVSVNPARLAKILKRSAGVIAVLLGLFALSRGLLFYTLALFGFAAVSFDLLPFGRSARRWSRSSNHKSEVRSSLLRMELDHDSGEMDGDVLEGEFAGRSLSSMDITELVLLYRHSLTLQDQSAQLLEAYLNRHHAGWHEDAGAGTADASGSGGGGGGDAGPMTAEEAYAVLGLEPGADEKAIKKAHRALMRQFHPDKGGSDYLAGKINEAKDVLLAVR